MFDLELSLLLKIISSIFFLISGIVWKKLLMNENKNYHYIFFRALASIFFLLLIKVCLNENEIFSVITFYDLIFCLSLCLFSFWGLYFYTVALQNGRFSFVTPLIVISSAISFITSLVVYNETLSIAKYLSLAFIALGLFLHQKDKLLNFKISKEVFFILLFSIFWGISFVFYLIPIKKFGVINFSIIFEVCVLISCIGLFFSMKNELHRQNLLPKIMFFVFLWVFLWQLEAYSVILH